MSSEFKPINKKPTRIYIMATSNADLDMAYKIFLIDAIRDVGSNDGSIIIYELEQAKKMMGKLKIGAVAAMVFGVALMIILVGFVLFGLGLFFFLKISKTQAKYQYFIDKARVDPSLSHN